MMQTEGWMVVQSRQRTSF